LAAINSINSSIIKEETEFKSLLAFMHKDAPEVKTKMIRLAALREQLVQEKKRLTSGNQQSLNKININYQEIKFNTELAAVLYKSALAGLEIVRAEAYRKLKHLLVIEHPALAQEDKILYDQTMSLLNKRSRLAKTWQNWCFSFIDRLDESAVTEVAYMQSENEPVSLVIKHKGVVIDRCVAYGFRSGLVQFGVPNKGFVGFSLLLLARLDHRNILAEVESTGQISQRKY
jgi:hypothetical protein